MQKFKDAVFHRKPSTLLGFTEETKNACATILVDILTKVTHAAVYSVNNCL